MGPVIHNPNNPKNVVAWADILIGFGKYLLPREFEVVERLPGNNSSYKREVLLHYVYQLETMMENETLFHKDLRQKGYQLYLESASQISHLNFERPSSFIVIKFLSGRIFGAARAQLTGWTLENVSDAKIVNYAWRDACWSEEFIHVSSRSMFKKSKWK